MPKTKEPRRLSIFEFFDGITEPRVERTRAHPLPTILTIALLTLMVGGQGWEDMEVFGEAKEEWLATFLDLRNGVPSADTFRRVVSALNPKEFNLCFIAWVNALSEGTCGKLIALDGKTIRHSFDTATKKKALHLVSAWIHDNKLTLGQIATAEKSNEITAIPELLKLLDIRGATITVDAMGCQRTIAEQIVEQGGDYVMGLKGNQGNAHSEVAAFFDDARATEFRDTTHTFDESVDGSEHGRVEVRRVWACQSLEWFADLPKWRGLRSIIMIERERTVGDTPTSIERHYYWSSRGHDADTLGVMIRSHWGIENSLHWCLDVGFREDDSRIRRDNGTENIALLRKIAMNLAKSETTRKRGIRAKMLLAGLSDPYLIKLLQAGLPQIQAK
jgi:predicted transposase YbfD/YdcC